MYVCMYVRVWSAAVSQMRKEKLQALQLKLDKKTSEGDRLTADKTAASLYPSEAFLSGVSCMACSLTSHICMNHHHV